VEAILMVTWICSLILLLTLAPVASAGGGKAWTNFEAAKFEIGQADFTGEECNQDGLPAANNFCSPEGAPARGKGRLYIPDSDDSRVLGFNNVPRMNDASANFVLGEPNFSTTLFTTGNPAFNYPTRLTTTGHRLFVVDFSNSRVLIWNKLPTATDAPADVVVGQPDFTSNSSATTRSGLALPDGVAVKLGKLFVSDRNNNRILIWNEIPITNGADADIVVGQSDFTSFRPGTTRTNLNSPLGLWTDGKRLVVADRFNNRVLIWNSIPTTNGVPADVVVGQKDFTSFDDPFPPTAESLSGPFDVTSDGKRLFVADTGNVRVLIYEPFPTRNGPTATVVLGESDFNSAIGNAPDGVPSAQNFGSPSGVSYSKGQLFVSDEGDSRVLVFEK
jgi:NHL repeat